MCITSVDKSDSHSAELHFKLISVVDPPQAACKLLRKTLHHKPLTRIILMNQIRGNGLLTVIKVDAITRSVKAVSKLWEPSD